MDQGILNSNPVAVQVTKDCTIIDPGPLPRLLHRLRLGARTGGVVDRTDLINAADAITMQRQRITELEGDAKQLQAAQDYCKEVARRHSEGDPDKATQHRLFAEWRDAQPDQAVTNG
jgi:hypothetical protein